MSTLETPWGLAHEPTDVGGGIIFAQTGSHGGYFVPPALNVLVPESWREASFNRLGMTGWYEEDCDWCLVALTFPQQSPAHAHDEARRTFKWFSERNLVVRVPRQS